MLICTTIRLIRILIIFPSRIDKGFALRLSRIKTSLTAIKKEFISIAHSLNENAWWEGKRGEETLI